jgi:hypothetical protein
MRELIESQRGIFGSICDPAYSNTFAAIVAEL